MRIQERTRTVKRSGSRRAASRRGAGRTLPAVSGVVILGLALAVTAPACGSRTEDRGAVPIARVGGRRIFLQEFEPMLRATSAGSSRDLPDPVKSRLLDQYLEQQVLLEEARLRGIQVADPELDRVLAREGQRDAGPEYREIVRGSLMVDKLLRAVMAESARITPEEEERFFREHPGAFHRPAVLVVRQILLENRERAAALRAELAAHPDRFASAARQHSLSPDRGSPRAYTVGELPREVAVAVRPLKPGQVSPVVEMPPNFLIFLLEEVRKERSIPLQEARPQIRAKLQEARGSGARSRLLADLERKMDVRLYEENLPFRYVREGPA